MGWLEYNKDNDSHQHRSLKFVLLGGVLLVSVITANGAAWAASSEEGGDEHGGGILHGLYPLGETSGVPRLPDEPVPYAVVPERPPLPIEWGCKFLGKGNIRKAFETPWGAVWTPCLLVFGTYRTALQSYQSVGPPGRTEEWRNRLDLFFNLQLSQTEKCVVGVGALDDNDFTKFSGYGFRADNRPELEGWDYHGPYLRALFCEGDFGSLFPKLDPEGTKLIDWGFSFGRQFITFQEGILINDVQDGIGIVRNNLHAPGFSNIRITAWFAWNNIDRGSPATIERLHEPGLFGIFTQADTPTTTWALDLAYIHDVNNDSTGGDGYWVGLAATQRAWSPWSRLGDVNTTYRANFSIADGPDTPQMADGAILSAEFSWTPHSSDDIVYVNPFWAIDRYTQAGREPIVGGPLAPLGISFASPSLGNYLSELNSFTVPNGLVGIAMGYQAFWDNHRRNVVFELAGTKGTESNDMADSAALTVQFQQAIGQRFQLQLEGFVNYLEARENGSGARIELLTQF